ncbi:amino acid ABC transporter permease [Brucella pituitosa]|uniref:amino acid ABC transporter permease n=1 Tax=Brucella pituitosa TaxID=571256 RepID=UPI000F5F8034|nr:amino acid ABC transporter permease [Brucellaceae bacterium VT-16-1752]
MNIDFTWLANPVYQGWLLTGVSNTLLLSFFGLIFMLIIGVLGATCVHFKMRGIAPVVTVLVELFRNTPSLVQLFFLYFMLSEMGLHFIDPETGRNIPLFSGFTCVVIMLGLYNGAIAVDIIRSGLLSVPKETVEAAHALGYSGWQVFIYVELPIGLRLTIPLMTNNVVTLIKTSSQAALVAVADLMYSATQIISETFMSLEVMVTVLVIYVVIVTAAVIIIGRIATATRMPGYGQ